MEEKRQARLIDTGERMIPPGGTEVSIVFARHRFAYEFACRYVAGKIVLDVGCGTGYGCRIIADTAKRVVGLDRDSDALAYCSDNYSAPNIEYRRADVSVLSLAETVDVAIAFQVIEHLADPAGFLARLKKTVKPGGTILITTPNSRASSGSPSDNPFHISEMSHGQFVQVMRENFQLFEVLGVGYAHRSRLREFVLKSPLYTLGKLLTRDSALKKAGVGALNMTEFRILSDRVAQDAIDLLAVCTNLLR
jgi:SAM-dependent methyltransferase